MRGTTDAAVWSTVRAFMSNRKFQVASEVSCTASPMRKPPASCTARRCDRSARRRGDRDVDLRRSSRFAGANSRRLLIAEDGLQGLAASGRPARASRPVGEGARHCAAEVAGGTGHHYRLGRSSCHSLFALGAVVCPGSAADHRRSAGSRRVRTRVGRERVHRSARSRCARAPAVRRGRRARSRTPESRRCGSACASRVPGRSGCGSARGRHSENGLGVRGDDAGAIDAQAVRLPQQPELHRVPVDARQSASTPSFCARRPPTP